MLTIRNEFLVYFVFLQLDFTRTCNTLKEKRVVWLLTVDAPIERRMVVPFMDKMHVRLPELSVLGSGTPNDLLPKPMGKYDPLVMVVRYSDPRGCAVLMHTTFGLTRKSLSKFTGMHGNPTVWILSYSSNGEDHVRALYDKGSAKILVNGASCIEVVSLADFSSFVYEMEHDSFVDVMVHKRGAADSAKLLLSAQGCLH